MPIPSIVRHSGVLANTQTSTGCGGRDSDVADTSFVNTYEASKDDQVDVAGVSPQTVTLPLGNVTKVRVLLAKAVGTSVVLLLTSASGADQAVPLSAGGQLLLHLPEPGDEITAIKVTATNATVAYFLAGDHA